MIAVIMETCHNVLLSQVKDASAQAGCRLSGSHWELPQRMARYLRKRGLFEIPEFMS